MRWLKAIWFWLTTSTQFALLEAENQRLSETNLVLENELVAARRENRSLINARLKQAGIELLPDVPEEKPQPIQRVRHLSLHQRQRMHALKTDPRRMMEDKNAASA